jgi:selenoprotein W-related protein
VSATADLLSNYQHVIDELTLKMGGSGVFDVVVNDSLIYSKDETGRHAEPGEVLGLFKEVIGPDVPVYGT